MKSDTFGVHLEVECEIWTKLHPDGHPVFPTSSTAKFSFSWSHFLKSFLYHNHTLVSSPGLPVDLLFCPIGLLVSQNQCVLLIKTLYNTLYHLVGLIPIVLLFFCSPLVVMPNFQITSELACLVSGWDRGKGSCLKCSG